MISAMRIAALTNDAEVIAALSDLLIEVVAHGGSVSFMYPLARDVAEAFWKDSLARAAAGGRVVLGAWEGDDQSGIATLVGTVTLELTTPPNQPHRAEIAKLMTRVRRRGRGIARSLMLEAERIAVNADARCSYSTPRPRRARRRFTSASAISASVSSRATR